MIVRKEIKIQYNSAHICKSKNNAANFGRRKSDENQLKTYSNENVYTMNKQANKQTNKHTHTHELT